MNKQDWAKFNEMMTTLKITFQAECNEATVKAYWLALKDLPLSDISVGMECAVRKTTESYGKLPLPGKIRELARGANTDGRSDKAWEHVIKAISRYGCGRTVDFDDRAINQTLRSIGGWSGLGKCDERALDWKRKEFVEAYEDVLRKGVDEDLARPLPGHSMGKAFVLTGLVDDPKSQLDAPSNPSKILSLIGKVTEGMEIKND